MMRAAVLAGLCGAVAAQKAGKLNTEGAPQVPLRECVKGGSCTTEQKSIVLDGNWRWVHDADGYENCYKDSDWVPKFCPDPATCTQKCALEAVSAADYGNTYGITAAPQGLQLKFVSGGGGGGANYGSRVYLLDDKEHYKMFHLKNREFTFTVDVSQLPCGLNGALYFVEMDRSGGKGATNEAGAAYGTGYCDAQCPHDIKFIAGEANTKDWKPRNVPPVGHYGSCCAEMDIWEANSMATAYTPHPCSIEGAQRCEGTTCGDTDAGERYNGVCDKDGCDFNSYRMGETRFFGAGSGFKLDSTKPVTVVTQFLTADGTDHGELSEIRRLYVQDGKVVNNSDASLLGAHSYSSVTDAFCSAQKSAFGDTDDFKAKGSLKQMGAALDRGMVLVMSLWDDTQVKMQWLDSTYPKDRPAGTLGVARGPCPGGETSEPAYLRSHEPNSAVRFTDLAVGEIGSTFSAGRRLGEMLV